MITIHQICYNESLILEFAYNFYKVRFPSAKFILHDNQSTDGSVEIAKRLGYKIEPFDTGEKLDDAILLNVKSNCWKNDDTDWVLVADMDELININESQLKEQENKGVTVIQSHGFQMINTEDELNLDKIVFGFRDSVDYDKVLVFNKLFINDMGWSHGCHISNPIGRKISWAQDRFTLLHYKYLTEDYIVSRYKCLKERQSWQNINNNWGHHYNIEEQNLRDFYRNKKNSQLERLI